ncbi:MAG: membrane associated rhomboid family serine protease [Arenicella sp.]|jgi:membrane associated rhomboid family serine protease
MLKLTPVVKVLLIINVAIFLIQEFALPGLKGLFAMYYWDSPNFKVFQVLTHIFTHANFSHLFHNMLSVLFLAPLIEQFMGSNRFLTFYMICGLGASALYVGIQTYEFKTMESEASYTLANFTPENVNSYVNNHFPGAYARQPSFYKLVNEQFYNNPTNKDLKNNIEEIIMTASTSKINESSLVGASGAVFGVLMAFLLMFPNMKLMLLFLPFPIKAKYLVSAYGLYEVYQLIQNNPTDNVAHLAHLGGMLFAFIMIKLVWKIPRTQ